MSFATPAVEEKPDGAPEWMVSFADMITIMMSFFVIMFALATARNEGKKAAAMESIEYRFGPKWRPFVNPGMGLYKDGQPRKGAGRNVRRLVLTPQADDDAGGRQFGRANIPAAGDLAGLGGSVYFDELAVDPGNAQKANLKRIADAAAGKPQKIEVLGHATRRPLPPDCPYRDPWDLAYARCRRVTELLAAMGIDPQRIRMGVAGATEPVPRQDPRAYARQNSRVDIYLLDILVTDFAHPGDEVAARSGEK
jgi:chemotaxis protein MotB